MKNILSFIAVFMLFTSINSNAITICGSNTNQLLLKQSCFSFYHSFFHEHYGGINLDNLGDFNDLVHQCQDMFEN